MERKRLLWNLPMEVVTSPRSSKATLIGSRSNKLLCCTIISMASRCDCNLALATKKGVIKPKTTRVEMIVAMTLTRVFWKRLFQRHQRSRNDCVKKICSLEIWDHCQEVHQGLRDRHRWPHEAQSYCESFQLELALLSPVR